MWLQTPPRWANIHAACPCSAGCFGPGTGHRRDYLIVPTVCHMLPCYLCVQMASFVALPLQTVWPDDSLSGSEKRIHWANIRGRRLYLPTPASVPPPPFTGRNVANCGRGETWSSMTAACCGGESRLGRLCQIPEEKRSEPPINGRLPWHS